MKAGSGYCDELRFTELGIAGAGSAMEATVGFYLATIRCATTGDRLRVGMLH